MKIAELFGGNRYIATIGIICSQNGIVMSERDKEKIERMLQNNQSFFVFVNKYGLNTVLMREKSDLLSKSVYEHLKRGKVLFFHGRNYREITRDNWKETQQMIYPAKVLYDDRIPVPERERTAFDDAMPERLYRKTSKQGFLRTQTAHEAMDRLSRPIM